MGSDIRAGGAFVEVFVKGNALKELDKVGAKLKSVGDSAISAGKKLAGVGAAITAPLLLAAERFASVGSEIHDAAERTGVGVEALQELKYAAEQSGASLEDMEAGLRKMNKAIFEAEGGSDQAKKSLASLGLTVEQLKGKKPEDQFSIISARLADISDSGAAASVAMELFGKGGTKLLPMMASLAAAREEARKLGIIMSKDDTDAADRFGDTLSALWKQINAVTIQVGAAVAQALLPFAQTAILTMRSVIGWAREHRPLIIAVLATGAALTAAGTALITFGVGLKAVGVAMSGIKSAFSLVGTTIGLLTNPIILVAAGLALLAGYFVLTTDAGGKAMTWLGNKFYSLKKIADEAFGGIADALGAGDIALAGQILWTGLKLAFVTGTQELQTIWIGLKETFVGTFVDVQVAVTGIWDAVVGHIKEGITELTGSFAGFVNILKKYGGGALSLLPDLKLDTKAQADLDAVHNDRAKEEVAAQQKRVDEANATKAAAAENAKSDIDAIQKQKDALEKQLHGLRGKAKDEKKAADDTFHLSVIPKPQTTDLDDVLAGRQGSSLKNIGIFSVNALQSLQGSGTTDRIAKATEDTARNTKRLVDKGALLFT